MPTSVGPNTKGEENLVFGYDLGDVSNSYKGEPTVNYITTMAANLGGNVSLSYPLNVYICTAQETNVVDPTAPGGQYSRFTGNTDSDNNQLFTSFVDGSVNARNTTVAYSVYLKGTGTCHLTVYSDIAGYSITPTITLTSEWTRYSIVQAVGNYTTHAWAAVRGILTSTNVYVAAQQVEFNSHVTPFVNGTRSATQGLLDLTGNSTLDLTNVSFDSNAQIEFDGTNDYINLNSIAPLIAGGDFSLEAIIKGPAQDHKGIIPINTSTGDNRALFLIRNASMGIYDGNTWYIGNIDVDDNNWHHVTLSYTRSTRNAVIYVDGEVSLNTTTGNTITVASDDKISVGQEYDGASTSDHFNGQIPIAKIYNRALTASEIKSNYNAIKGRFNI